MYLVDIVAAVNKTEAVPDLVDEVCILVEDTENK